MLWNRLLLSDATSLSGKHKVFVVIISWTLDSPLLCRAKGNIVLSIIYHITQPKYSRAVFRGIFLIDRVLRMRSRNDSRPLSSHVAGPSVAPSVNPDIWYRDFPLQPDSPQIVISEPSVLFDASDLSWISLYEHLSHIFYVISSHRMREWQKVLSILLC